MLPFLPKFKKFEDGTSIIIREPDKEKEQENPGLEYCAQQFMDALRTNDAKAVARAFQDMVAVCEMTPLQESLDEMNE